MGPMSLASLLSPADLPAPSTRPVPRPSRGDGWNTLADVEVFVFAVESELEAMDRERVGVHRRGCKPDLSLRRRAIGLIWMLTVGGMQWRIAGLLSGIPLVVERLFAWLSRHRRLNIVYDRAPDLFAAHVWIAKISILSRRLVARTQPQQGIYSRTHSVRAGAQEDHGRDHPPSREEWRDGT